MNSEFNKQLNVILKTIEKLKEMSNENKYLSNNEYLSYPKNSYTILDTLDNDILGMSFRLSFLVQEFSNEIVYPSAEKLMSYLKIRRSRFYEVMNILEENNIIKRVKKSGIGVIYFNPFILCISSNVDQEVEDMFRKDD